MNVARHVALCLLAAAMPALAACGDGYPRRAEVDGHTVAFATRPAALKVGQHFELEGVLCTRAPMPTSLRVDADMPAHRHGMNYRATTTLHTDGRFTSRGLLMHMPGRWRFIFDFGSFRATRDIEIE